MEMWRKYLLIRAIAYTNVTVRMKTGTVNHTNKMTVGTPYDRPNVSMVLFVLLLCIVRIIYY